MNARLYAVLLAVAAVTFCLSGAVRTLAAKAPRLTKAADPTGVLGNLSAVGAASPSEPFLRSLGTNGRTCGSCHNSASGWSLTPSLLQARFQATGGTDPVFRPVDGANSPNADVSTLAARQAAYSLLLARGVIRVGLPMPADAEFTLTSVQDPYGFASAAQLSLFRRPLPATNLRFLSTVMWDGRETQAGTTLATDLANQAADATLTHEQGTQAPSSAILQEIVTEEMGQTTAQLTDSAAGMLTARKGLGGPKQLLHQAYSPGANDPFQPQNNGAFNPNVFPLFQSWAKPIAAKGATAARNSIERGQVLFNTKAFNLVGVAGVNDVLGQPVVAASCSSCHNVPGVGNRAFNGLMNIGVESGLTVLSPDFPAYTLLNTSTGETVTVSDPGQALITGQWADVSKFKVPGLRALAARAPYFHNGSAATLADVVQFYDSRFGIGLNPQEANDLTNFLGAL